MDPSSDLLPLEDDADIGTTVSRFMREQGFRVSYAYNGEVLDRMLDDRRIDLILLGLTLPGEDGLSVCLGGRTVSTVPIISLTALGVEADRAAGLDLGATDCLTKPFNTGELLARVRGVLRRSKWAHVATERIVLSIFDKWRLSLITRQFRSLDCLQVRLPLANSAS